MIKQVKINNFIISSTTPTSQVVCMSEEQKERTFLYYSGANELLDIKHFRLNKLKKKFTTTDRNKKINIRSIQVEHGNVKSNCFLIDEKIAYISDVSKIYKKDYRYFKNFYS